MRKIQQSHAGFTKKNGKRSKDSWRKKFQASLMFAHSKNN